HPGHAPGGRRTGRAPRPSEQRTYGTSDTSDRGPMETRRLALSAAGVEAGRSSLWGKKDRYVGPVRTGNGHPSGPRWSRRIGGRREIERNGRVEGSERRGMGAAGGLAGVASRKGHGRSRARRAATALHDIHGFIRFEILMGIERPHVHLEEHAAVGSG